MQVSITEMELDGEIYHIDDQVVFSTWTQDYSGQIVSFGYKQDSNGHVSLGVRVRLDGSDRPNFWATNLANEGLITTSAIRQISKKK